MSIEKQLRAKRPKMACAADHGNSRKAAIHLNCIACQGGSRKAATVCTIQECFLWPFRPSASGERDPGAVPTEKAYLAAHDATITDAQREAGKRLASKGDK
jgi:hypothetical protein